MRCALAVAAAAALGLGAGCVASPEWDADATKSLEADVIDMFHSMDQADFDKLLDHMSPDATAFDMDMENHPVQMYGKAGIAEMFQGIKAAIDASQGGMALQTTLVKHVVHATGVMGYAAVEFDQTITVGGQAMGPFKFRGSESTGK